jgi:hypothetical protein
MIRAPLSMRQGYRAWTPSDLMLQRVSDQNEATKVDSRQMQRMSLQTKVRGLSRVILRLSCDKEASSIGVRRGVSKGVEDARRPSALWAVMMF